METRGYEHPAFRPGTPLGFLRAGGGPWTVKRRTAQCGQDFGCGWRQASSEFARCSPSAVSCCRCCNDGGHIRHRRRTAKPAPSILTIQQWPHPWPVGVLAYGRLRRCANQKLISSIAAPPVKADSRGLMRRCGRQRGFGILILITPDLARFSAAPRLQ